MARTGKPRVRPPAELSPAAWQALITISRETVRQTEPPRVQRVCGVTHGIDPRVLGPLLTQGWVRAAGERPRLRYQITAAGRDLLEGHPALVDAYTPPPTGDQP